MHKKRYDSSLEDYKLEKMSKTTEEEKTKHRFKFVVRLIANKCY